MLNGPPSFMQKMISLFSELLPDVDTAHKVAEGFALVFSDIHTDIDLDDLYYHVDPIDETYDFAIEPSAMTTTLTKRY
ncbi:MAG: hypothetical protein AB7I18_04455 [Candidatus Berkiella sp.]